MDVPSLYGKDSPIHGHVNEISIGAIGLAAAAVRHFFLHDLFTES